MIKFTPDKKKEFCKINDPDGGSAGRMSVVISMAGEGRRFLQRGFLQAKFKLIAKDRPLFDWALESLRNFFEFGDFVFAALPGNEKFIVKRCRILGIKRSRIFTLDRKTDGQATTVFNAVGSVDPNSSLLIYNIDTFILPDMLQPEDIDSTCCGWLLLFKAPGDHWSFAKLDPGGRVIEVSEKKRISAFASTGLYYFGTIGLFRQAYSSLREQVKREHQEVYVAPLYKYLILKNHIIKSKVILSRYVTPLGTPDEVKKFDPYFFKRYSIDH